MQIDPHTAQGIVDLSIRLSEVTIRNTSGAIRDKIKASKTKREQKEVIQELEEIIDDLIEDKRELRQIAEAYNEEFVAQHISQKEITYIIDNIIPVLENLIEHTPVQENSVAAVNAANMEKTLDTLKSILSVETLTVLQLVGFNFKQAIGEPLTLLLQKFITSKASVDTQSNVEFNILSMAFNVELAKIAQDKDTTERWVRLKSQMVWSTSPTIKRIQVGEVLLGYFGLA